MGDAEAAGAGPPPAKRPKLLGDDVVWKPAGDNVNLITVGSKSCTHEVLWPPETGGGGGAGAGGDERSMMPPAPRPGPPARTYPFPLDPFQTTAIACLEARHNVLVAAHTSAGKTVVAEYAMAMALRDNARVIYTSPLKALSNEKYRQFKGDFGDVGLMTGDVTIDPGASCLVMTTEILRSMLYRGSDVVSEASLLVFDEVHYLRDAERGVVWEECIALAPRGARMAFLSATLPNAAEFAGWVAASHGSPCHVVYTDYRPTPLQHFIWPTGCDDASCGMFLVVDESGIFRDNVFQEAVARIGGASIDAAVGSKKGGSKKEKKKDARQAAAEDILRLVAMCVARDLAPLIVFSFGKREVESNAEAVLPLDLTTDEEKAMVETTFNAAIDSLSPEDRQLKQIVNLLPMLKRGVGVHHSGLLPILKEAVELMFQEGWVKVLFATETFSTGLNMPARTVAFTRARKFDGSQFRWVSSGEYIQMSGRAGRRGKDARGNVILMLDAKMEPAVAKAMIKGAPDALTSAFGLRESMLLGLARVEGASPEALLAQSFRQWQAKRALPALQARAEALAARRDGVVVEDAGAVEELLDLVEQRAAMGQQLRAATVARSDVALRFLQPGRLVRVAPGPPETGRPLPQLGPVPKSAALDDGDAAAGDDKAAGSSGSDDDEGGAGSSGQDGGAGPSLEDILQLVDGGVWGVLVSFEKLGKNQVVAGTDGGGVDGDGSSFRDSSEGPRFAVDVLVACDPATLPRSSGSPVRALPRLLPPEAEGSAAHVVTLPLDHLASLSSARMKGLTDLRAPEARKRGLAAVAEVVRRQRASGRSGPPLLDPQADMRAGGKDVERLVRRLESLDARIAAHPLARSPALAARLGALQAKRALAAAARVARREAKAAAGLVLGDELAARQRLLRRLGYMDSDGLVTTKGRVAADLQAGDEIVLTEMIFTGAFNGLPTNELAALCSCFVWVEKSDGGARLPQSLRDLYRALTDTARRVGKAREECKLGVEAAAYAESFRPELMNAVDAWARGVRFSEVIKMAEVFEGSLVRAVRRLEELMRQVGTALRAVGDTELAARFDESRAAIKRDVIFAASLYL
ncbi:hypothetical protein Rsub_08503 [Raphidocelis subcapitata]|uniref:Uncharacterized protein n=1 Tax=Raphidocelis subcapitata TaxID=307507 RepID=A0A2V0PAD3_9CHLO|nr:hypothetical protein Rsub_08503 [Raphidocelis subcapitata]|eukprot:GBF95912.1 hypothetical protein Rsub_08503 [Raphidocelis subcapitata]